MGFFFASSSFLSFSISKSMKFQFNTCHVISLERVWKSCGCYSCFEWNVLLKMSLVRKQCQCNSVDGIQKWVSRINNSILWNWRRERCITMSSHYSAYTYVIIDILAAHTRKCAYLRQPANRCFNHCSLPRHLISYTAVSVHTIRQVALSSALRRTGCNWNWRGIHVTSADRPSWLRFCVIFLCPSRQIQG